MRPNITTGLILATGLLAAPLLANASPCAITTLDTFSKESTTCSIGNITYTFSNPYEYQQIEGTNATGQDIQNSAGYFPSNITFTPFVNGNVQGFMLSGLPDLSAKDGEVFTIGYSETYLYFTANTGSSDLITGVRDDASGSLSIPRSAAYAFATADASSYGALNQNQIGSGGYETYYLQPGDYHVDGFEPVSTNSIVYSQAFVENAVRQSTLDGIEENLVMVGGTAGTFAFRTEGSVIPVPEPGSLTLLDSGLAVLIIIIRRRLKA